MGNCCRKDTKYATYKKELGAPFLKELKSKGFPEGNENGKSNKKISMTKMNELILM